MTLDELKTYLFELQTDVERKIEWTLTDHVSLSDARKYTGGIQIAIEALKVKVDELQLIEAFNDETV